MNYNSHDSQQLQWLRARYIDAGNRRPSTPYRLGIYAFKTSSKISDYGTHSSRWVKLFDQGMKDAAEWGW